MLPNVRPGVQPTPAPSLSPLSTVLSPHRIICPPGHTLSPSKHTKILCYLIQIQLPPPIPRPHDAFQIPVATPLPSPKYLLTFPSAVSEPPSTSTTAHSDSPIPRIPYPYCKTHILVSMPTTPSLPSVAYKYTSPVSEPPLL